MLRDLLDAPTGRVQNHAVQSVPAANGPSPAAATAAAFAVAAISPLADLRAASTDATACGVMRTHVGSCALCAPPPDSELSSHPHPKHPPRSMSETASTHRTHNTPVRQRNASNEVAAVHLSVCGVGARAPRRARPRGAGRRGRAPAPARAADAERSLHPMCAGAVRRRRQLRQRAGRAR